MNRCVCIEANRELTAQHWLSESSRQNARSSQNSFKHGLTLRLSVDPARRADIEKRAGQLVGPRADLSRLHLLWMAAEAELELKKVRDLRVAFFNLAQGRSG